jgi:hypothetical protein
MDSALWFTFGGLIKIVSRSKYENTKLHETLYTILDLFGTDIHHFKVYPKKNEKFSKNTRTQNQNIINNILKNAGADPKKQSEEEVTNRLVKKFNELFACPHLCGVKIQKVVVQVINAFRGGTFIHQVEKNIIERLTAQIYNLEIQTLMFNAMPTGRVEIWDFWCAMLNRGVNSVYHALRSVRFDNGRHLIPVLIYSSSSIQLENDRRCAYTDSWFARVILSVEGNLQEAYKKAEQILEEHSTAVLNECHELSLNRCTQPDSKEVNLFSDIQLGIEIKPQKHSFIAIVDKPEKEEFNQFLCYVNNKSVTSTSTDDKKAFDRIVDILSITEGHILSSAQFSNNENFINCLNNHSNMEFRIIEKQDSSEINNCKCTCGNNNHQVFYKLKLSDNETGVIVEFDLGDTCCHLGFAYHLLHHYQNYILLRLNRLNRDVDPEAADNTIPTELLQRLFKSFNRMLDVCAKYSAHRYQVTDCIKTFNDLITDTLDLKSLNPSESTPQNSNNNPSNNVTPPALGNNDAPVLIVRDQTSIEPKKKRGRPKKQNVTNAINSSSSQNKNWTQQEVLILRQHMNGTKHLKGSQLHSELLKLLTADGVNRTEKQIKTRLGTEATIAKKKKVQESSVVKPGRPLGNKNIVSIKSKKKVKISINVLSVLNNITNGGSVSGNSTQDSQPETSQAIGASTSTQDSNKRQRSNSLDINSGNTQKKTKLGTIALDGIGYTRTVESLVSELQYENNFNNNLQ